MIFYDFEVFENDWLVVMTDMKTQEEHVIINDKKALEKIYREHKDDIFVGYNNRHYDQYIFQGILAGFDPKEINDWIIIDKKNGWEFSGLLRKFPMNNYDVMSNIDRGLKSFEGFMGNDIRESSVPFDIKRKLTPSEIAETVKYCRHDVHQTIEVFIERYSDFEAQMGLLKMFHLPLSDINKTKVQLSAKILDAHARTYDDEFDISFPNTMRISKYKFVVDWYKNPANRKYRIDPNNPKSKKNQLECLIAGVPHIFGWGGVHGAREQYAGEGFYLNMDVASLYPTLMIVYNLLSRSCNPQKFKDIVELRLKYKKEKNPMQAPLKIVINGTYGAMKSKSNPLYDPRQANNVCVYGQLLILDLIEKLEPYCQIIQTNTDGVLVKLNATTEAEADREYALIDDIAYEWEKRTGLTLEFDEYRRIYQKDVNNYVIVDRDGHIKSKGAYVKKLSRLDYDLPIVNKAMVEYMVHGTPIEKTIYKCDDLKEFQMVTKISAKYLYIMHGNKILKEKTVRAFASKNLSDGGLVKVKYTDKNTPRREKMQNTPEHVFMYNDNVEGVKCPQKLDKKWYLDMTRKRLEDFGIEVK